MKKQLVLLLVLLLCGTLLAACIKNGNSSVQVQSEKSGGLVDGWTGEQNLLGIIGGQSIHMNLMIRGDEISGSYYDDQNKSEVTLKGLVNHQGFVEIYQLDGSGKNTGGFSGRISDNKINGTWYSGDKTQMLPFQLIQENPSSQTQD